MTSTWRVNAIIEKFNDDGVLVASVLVGNDVNSGDMVSARIPGHIDLPSWLSQYCVVDSAVQPALDKEGAQVLSKQGQNVLNCVGKITCSQEGAHF